MSDTLVKIPVLSYVKRHMPADFSLGTSNWFKKETCTINFGEYTGSYGTVGILRAQILNPLFAQGWYIVSATDQTDISSPDGKKVTRTETHSGDDVVKSLGTDTLSGSSTTDGTAKNESFSESKSDSNFFSNSTSSSEAGVNFDDSNYVDSSGSSGGNSHAEGYGKATSNATSKSTDTNNNVKTNREKTDTTTHGHVIKVETTDKSDPYYCSKAVVKLERWIFDNQKAINSLAASFVSAHNDGKKINVDRYDELVKLYATVVSRTEDEMNNIRPIAPKDIRDLIDGVVRDCKSALDLFRNKVGEIPDTFGESRIAEINRKFDKLLEDTRSQLITQGIYNSTVWPTTQSGIERDRQIALSDLMDKLVELRIDAYGKIATLTCDIGGKVIDVLGKFREIVDMFIKLTEVRNDIFVRMCTFMEKREDSYPGAETIGAGVSKLALQTGAVN